MKNAVGSLTSIIGLWCITADHNKQMMRPEQLAHEACIIQDKVNSVLETSDRTAAACNGAKFVGDAFICRNGSSQLQ